MIKTRKANLIKNRKANLIMGGQWGSEGKGKLAGWIYENYHKISMAITDFTPNAGHTFVDGGFVRVSKVIPIGAMFSSVETVIIGPHSVFDIDRFFEEMDEFGVGIGNQRIFIHPMAQVLTSENKYQEKGSLRSISSTMQGSAAAQIEKIMRNPNNISLAKDCPKLGEYIADTHVVVQNALSKGRTALIETAQGYDLGLNHGYMWPYVTGRDCMLGRWLDNAGVHPRQLGSVITALRTYPIRVGSLPNSTSGPCHSDQKEISWDTISESIGVKTIEYTTVTKRIRRVFTWSDEQVSKMCRMIKPDYAFLNYINYVPVAAQRKVIDETAKELNEYDCKLALVGTGADLSDMVVL